MPVTRHDIDPYARHDAGRSLARNASTSRGCRATPDAGIDQLTQAGPSVPAVRTGDGGGGGSVDSTAAGSTVRQSSRYRAKARPRPGVVAGQHHPHRSRCHRRVGDDGQVAQLLGNRLRAKVVGLGRLNLAGWTRGRRRCCRLSPGGEALAASARPTPQRRGR